MNKAEKQIIFEVLCKLVHISICSYPCTKVDYEKCKNMLNDLRFDRYTLKGKFRLLKRKLNGKG